MVSEDSGARFLDGIEGPPALRVSYRTGTVLPAHVASGGKALLAVCGPSWLPCDAWAMRTTSRRASVE